MAPYIYAHLWLLPSWVRDLHVRYYPQNDVHGPAVDASSTAERPYLWAGVTIFGSWLDDSLPRRRMAIVHELVHPLFAAMDVEHKQVLERTLKDGNAVQFHAYAEEQWRQRLEATVSELTALVLAVPMEHSPRIAYREVLIATNE